MEQIVADKLISLYQAKCHSLAQYISIAEPYYTSDQQPLINAISSIAQTETQHAAMLKNILDTNGIAYHTDSTDPIHTEYNYLSIDYLKTLLLNELKHQLQIMDQLRPHLPADLSAIQGETRSFLNLLE